MSLDPAKEIIARADPQRSLVNRIANLERKVRALEAERGTVQVSSGAPTQTVREGTLDVDKTNGRLWAYYAGAYHFVGLT